MTGSRGRYAALVSTFHVGAAVLAVGALVAGAAPAAAEPGAYGSNGVFGVEGNSPSGWATATIPPGRYKVDQSPSMYPYQSAPGFWLRCNAFPCTPTYPGNIIATGPALRDESLLMEIAPTDVAVSLHNVTLSAVT